MLPQYAPFDPELMKVNPSDVTNRIYGDQTHPSLFSYFTDDIISMTTSGGSPLMKWLPARGVNHWNDPIAHLSWIAPEGFTGSDSYEDYLADMEAVGECEFGDGYTYNICEYTLEMDRVSWSTINEPIKDEINGMRQFERVPTRVLRGQSAGITLDNDKDWSIARLALGAEDHLGYTILNGDPSGLKNTFEGIRPKLANGWVLQHKRGKGSCDFTDPRVISGVALNTPEAILRRIRALVRFIRMRAMERNYSISGDDMVIVMNPTMWTYIADAIAFGTLVSYGVPTNIELSISPEVVERTRARISGGGLGFGFIPIDGQAVPVIPETRLGGNSTLDGEPAITSDILVLTKRFRGINILEMQWLDWSNLERSPFAMPRNDFEPEFFQGGMIRVMPVRMNGNDRCWYYGAEMYGRVVSYMQPLQGVINDVTIPVDLDDEHESGSFTSRNFYAFNGAEGGAGNALLTELT